jgi:hypothetical protein
MHLYFPFLTALLAVVNTASSSFTMSTSTTNSSDASPVTRIATFRFHPNVTAEQKGDRASAFLALYAEHPELLVEQPKGGKPLNTPLNLTNVKRESVWDMGFVVMFKVCSCQWEEMRMLMTSRMKLPDRSLIKILDMIG